MPITTERSFTRATILERLRGVIASGKPIIGAGSSAGIVARSAEAGGAHLIIVYSTGRSRLMGLPTTPIGHSNPITLSMYDEIDNVVLDTPIIGGAEAGDPTYQRLPRLVQAFRDKGYDGIINFPSAGRNPEYAATREHTGQGLEREAEMIKIARDQDYFTLGYAYTERHTQLLAAAGCDVIVPHSGWTSGGDIGAGELVRDIRTSIDHTQKLIEIARKENPEVICLSHGGSLATPEDTIELYKHSDAQGFVGASSVERIPIEEGVRNAVRGFADQTIRDSARNGL
jgi:Predicted TIM-barrel enzyme, possibly a dioxygenase